MEYYDNRGRTRRLFLPGTYGYYFAAVEKIKELRQLFFSTLNHIGNFHIIYSAYNGTAGDTLDQTKLLPYFRRYRDCFELVVFT